MEAQSQGGQEVAGGQDLQRELVPVLQVPGPRVCQKVRLVLYGANPVGPLWHEAGPGGGRRAQKEDGIVNKAQDETLLVAFTRLC